MKPARIERIKLLNMTKFVGKYIEVVSKFAIEISESANSPDPDVVMPKIDKECRDLIAAYPGGMTEFRKDFMTFTTLIQQLRLQLIIYTATEIIKDNPDVNITKDEVDAALNKMLGIK